MTAEWDAAFAGRYVITPTGCWEWSRGRNRAGYGHQLVAGRKWYAHRLSRFLFFGDKPEAVCHTCDNPPCIRPSHLRAGTMQDNQQESWAKGRHDPLLNIRLTSEQVAMARAVAGTQRQGRRARIDSVAHRLGVSYRTVYRAIDPRTPGYRLLTEAQEAEAA